MAQTLNEILSNNTITLFNYQKHDANKNGRKTGSAVELNKCNNIIIFDIDINKSSTEESKQQVRDKFVQALDRFHNSTIVKTGSGGLHITALRDGFSCKNRDIKWFHSEAYDIDLFNSDVDKDKRSLVVLPGSKVRKNNSVIEYSFIKGDYNTIIADTADDILSALIDDGLVVKPNSQNLLKLMDQIEDSDNFAADFVVNTEDDDDNELNEFTREKLIIKGFDNVEIHADAGNRSIQQEITLLTLFEALNALPSQVIESAYNYIYSHARLTDSAQTRWDSMKGRCMNKSSNTFVLVKMLKIHNRSYYDTYLKPIYEKPIEFDPASLTFDDDFTWKQLVANCESSKYQSPNEVITDMLRLMRVCDTTKIYWIVKQTSNTWKIVSDEDQHKKLARVKCCDQTLWQIFLDNSTFFRVDDVKFNDPNPNVFNFFHGYKHKPVDGESYNVGDYNALTRDWFDFLFNVICSSRQDIFDYIENWISFIVRHPGQKTQTALVLKGMQRIGKGTFSEMLCRIFDGYVNENITNMDELVGNFNTAIEGKVLCFCNELKNVGDERVANFDALKSVITDYPIRYNEKGVPRRDGENVVNLVFMSNNAFILKLDVDDGRYVVLNVNPAKRGDQDYWTKIHKMIDNDGVIRCLMWHYLNEFDDSFNLRKIPNTEERKDMINSSKSDIVEMIEKHFKSFCVGTVLYDEWIPANMKPRTLGIQLAKYCDKKPSKKGKTTYTLKPEWVELLEDKPVEEE